MNTDLLKAINGLAGENAALDAIMKFSTNYALYVFAIILLAMWFFGATYMKKTVVYAAVTGVFALAINVIISKFYFEARPFVTYDDIHVLVDHAADASFPSDHTTGAMALAVAIFLRHKKIGSFAILFALLTGFSRIYVGNHYPLDVIAGIIIATIVALLLNSFKLLMEPLSNFILAIYNKIPVLPKKI
ncbi:undecaprenyl-diphosphatase [Kurthia sibirica]|uniref:Undecaprenyl-diphosphatase n=1 Tax=Kurthia sibirica TaxID=202750 RepID=A0A2U3AN65_9BACL|nr:undecaprenyl-diphosphatase [Kurthia sibirica]PWI25990.1 undecaprenyl-diphosphatase [Kurthia sibirica]GEK34977.1 undecaprenyl-diphosphatase BcrC [Kurthia sibirica]